MQRLKHSTSPYLVTGQNQGKDPAGIQRHVCTAAGSPVSRGNSGCLQKTEGTTQHHSLPSFRARGCGAWLLHGPWGSGHETVNPVAAVVWEKGIAESQARHACAC